ncbi:hypothetical protein SZN_23606 [Streptomyces zinciresistens K42]|uniref:Uncharacterized protein n=1 Tax=Streptomyces zinciresistens K42 TaxID=700597 RepID=G2GGT7_9ACTN|nr:hypothetical protein [Streptomyces zinciresistens]EGX57283.1 hypothetical protein SZN_23606 [Streptomyces zinciresistens K42]
MHDAAEPGADRGHSGVREPGGERLALVAQHVCSGVVISGAAAPPAPPGSPAAARR